MCKQNIKKLLEDIKNLQVNFILTYVIDKILVLLKIIRFSKEYLRSLMDIYLF